MPLPKIGEVYDGYSYAGGDPNKQSSWKWVGDGSQASQPLAVVTGQTAPGGPVMRDTDADQKTLADLSDKAANSLATAQNYERFIKLNRGAATGPGMAFPIIPLPKFMGESVRGKDVAGLFNDRYGQMQSIVAAEGPKQRPAGSGSSSDKDTNLYLQGGPRIENYGTTNEAIYNRKKAELEFDSARNAFMHTWFAKNGTLLGADVAFNKFWADRSAKAAAPASGVKYLGTE